jgi:hypothetical protein
LKRLNPSKLFVELRDGVTLTEPIRGRKYTLTHSDITADLFLTIGMQYAFDKISNLRDEVLAEWVIDGYLYLYVYVYVDGQLDPASSAIREEIFRRELPLALEAIRYGDRYLFESHPYLDNASIWVCFGMGNQENCKLEPWGYLKEY